MKQFVPAPSLECIVTGFHLGWIWIWLRHLTQGKPARRAKEGECLAQCFVRQWCQRSKQSNYSSGSRHAPCTFQRAFPHRPGKTVWIDGRHMRKVIVWNKSLQVGNFYSTFSSCCFCPPCCPPFPQLSSLLRTPPFSPSVVSGLVDIAKSTHWMLT